LRKLSKAALREMVLAFPNQQHISTCQCREPITDEFVVGNPKQIAPIRFAVFFP